MRYRIQICIAIRLIYLMKNIHFISLYPIFAHAYNFVKVYLFIIIIIIYLLLFIYFYVNATTEGS